MTSAGVIAVATIVAVIGSLIAPYSPVLPDLSLSWVGPAGGHLLGFDFEGRDVLSRLIAGAQSSMLGPLAVVVGAMALGTVSPSSRPGGRDRRHGDFLGTGHPVRVPRHPAGGARGRGIRRRPDRGRRPLAIAYMPYVARVLRGAALKERGQPYVAALEVQGSSAALICLRHIVPNMLPLIVAQATIMFGWAMVDLAAISFLGLGVQPPAPNWGVMISENQPGDPAGLPAPGVRGGPLHRRCRHRLQRPRRTASSSKHRRYVDDGQRADRAAPAEGTPLLDVDGLTVRLPVDGAPRACSATSRSPCARARRSAWSVSPARASR